MNFFRDLRGDGFPEGHVSFNDLNKHRRMENEVTEGCTVEAAHERYVKGVHELSVSVVKGHPRADIIIVRAVCVTVWWCRE